MAQAPAIQWFPGHMAKTRRMIEANVKLVDLVVEITDARIPQSSRNPELPKWIGRKKRLIILNKCDAADPKITARWLSWYREQGVPAIAVDAKSGRGMEKFLPTVREVLAEEIQRRDQRGMAGRPLRMMVVGIPNVGKSSFINRAANQRRARVEDRPGVTVGKQWVTVARDVELLDTPGVLWPKFEDQQVGLKLALIGSINDEILNRDELALELVNVLNRRYPGVLAERYQLENAGDCDTIQVLEQVARQRSCLAKGGELDLPKAARLLLDDFRSGRLGRITLEEPETAKDKGEKDQDGKDVKR